MSATFPAEILVSYLGWKPTNGITGSQFVEPIITELVHKRLGNQSESSNPLVKLILQLSKKKLRVFKEWKLPSGKVQRDKYPSIKLCDISFAYQYKDKHRQSTNSSSTAVFATIFLGQNSESAKPCHVHVYRAQTPQLAADFVELLNSLILTPDHLRQLTLVEKKLAREGFVKPSGLLSPESNGVSVLSSSHAQILNLHHTSRAECLDEEEDLHGKFQNLNVELKSKLGGTAGKVDKGVPLLLPPKDYDTFHRSQGKLHMRRPSQSLQTDSVAPSGVLIRKSCMNPAPQSRQSESPTSDLSPHIYENLPCTAEPDPDYELEDRELQSQISGTSSQGSGGRWFPSQRRNPTETSSSLSSTSQNHLYICYNNKQDYLNTSRNSKSSGYQSELLPRYQ